jgi:hypothetical protein
MAEEPLIMLKRDDSGGKAAVRRVANVRAKIPS